MPLLFVAVLAGAQLLTGATALAGGPATTNFEAFTVGDVNGQDGWTSGHGSSFCPVYDVGVVSNTYGYPSFGAQSLRISNAIACGSYNDQTFSPSLADEAGETAALDNAYSGGTRQPYFQAQWDFASTVPTAEQPGLAVVASADPGDPSRMTWLQMQDTPTGLQLNFEDYSHAILNFVTTPIATGLDRTVPHTVLLTVHFVDGPGNDVVNVYLDGALVHTGTTWEDYYRDWTAGALPSPVDSMMFRVAGTAVPAVSGNGFLIDNFSEYSGPVPSADLTGLSLSSGTLSPAFDASTTAYSTSVDNATTNLVVNATTNPGAAAVISGASNLAVGSNTVTITVTAADGVTTRTYTVTVDRAAPPTPAPTPIQPAPSPPPAPASLTPPRNLTGGFLGGITVLSWEPPAGNPTVAHYTVWKDGKVLGVTGGSTYQLIILDPVVGDTSIYQVSADDGRGNASPMSTMVTGVPDLTGLTAAQGRALIIARGFTVGSVTTKTSKAKTDTVIEQDPQPLPAYRPLGTPIDTVISLPETTAAALAVKIAASRRIPLAIRHSFTPLVLTTIPAKATISLTRYRNVRTTYATWTRPLHAGANYLTLRIPAHLNMTLPGIYRLTFRVRSRDQSRQYSVRVLLGRRVFDAPLPKREADILLVGAPSISDMLVEQLSARYRVKTVDRVTVFTATSAPNERVGAVVLDAGEAGLSTIRHLHSVFPDLRIVAVVSSPAAGRSAKAAGASVSVVNATSAEQLAARLDRALRTTLGK